MEKKRKKFIVLELLFTILLVVFIFATIAMMYPTFIELLRGKKVLNLNDKNREIVQKYIEESEYHGQNLISENAIKIQYFLAFNDDEYTIYYKDGTKKQIYDDHLYDLRTYIKKEGHSLANKYILLIVLLIFSCILINKFRKNIGQKIDFIDKNETNL